MKKGMLHTLVLVLGLWHARDLAAAETFRIQGTTPSTPTTTINPVLTPASPTGTTQPIKLSAGAKKVFVTSALYNGNLGGVVGAHAKCQYLAKAAGLTGTFHAWISDGSGSPALSFTRPSGGYKDVLGNTIASGWGDLTDGTLNLPIGYNERGNQIVSTEPWVWTGVLSNGTTHGGGCSGWTRAEGEGMIGNHTSKSASWTQMDPRSTPLAFTLCGIPKRLYCFEQ